MNKTVRGIVQVVGHASVPRVPKRDDLRKWYLQVCLFGPLTYRHTHPLPALQNSYVVIASDHKVLEQDRRKVAMAHGKIVAIGALDDHHVGVVTHNNLKRIKPNPSSF